MRRASTSWSAPTSAPPDTRRRWIIRLRKTGSVRSRTPSSSSRTVLWPTHVIAGAPSCTHRSNRVRAGAASPRSNELPLRPELERARDLQHAVRERAGADPHHEQERLVAEVAGGPEREEDLDGPERERQPPQRPFSSGDGHEDVEDSAEQQVEGEDRRQRPEAVPGMDEGEDRDHGKGDREHDTPEPRPPVRRRDREQLEQGRARACRADEDRDRADAARVELEDEQREDEPERADDEVEPPELGRFFRAGRRGGRRGA